MKQPMISIVTVVYNGISTIETTIQSVLNQTYRNLEYIVIDGGSTDGTVDIIKKYADQLAYWVSEADDGIYDAMNKGIRCATGGVVGIINSDDWYDVRALERVVAAFEKHCCDVVHGDVVFVDERGDELLVQSPNTMEDHMYLGMSYHHPTVFVRRSLYEECGAFQTKYRIAADYDLLLRFIDFGACFFYLPERLAYFRLSGVSATRRWRCLHETKRIAFSHFVRRYGSSREDFYARMKRCFWERRQEVLQRYLTERAQRNLGAENVRHIAEHLFVYGSAFVIFGAGLDGIRCYLWLRASGISVRCFVDNSPAKQKQKILRKLVLSLEECRAKMPEALILIASSDYQIEMEQQLENLGCRRFREYIRRADMQEAIFVAAYGEEVLTNAWMELV